MRRNFLSFLAYTFSHVHTQLCFGYFHVVLSHRSEPRVREKSMYLYPTKRTFCSIRRVSFLLIRVSLYPVFSSFFLVSAITVNVNEVNLYSTSQHYTVLHVLALISLWRVSRIRTHSINMKRVKTAHEPILSNWSWYTWASHAFWFSFLVYFFCRIETQTWNAESQVNRK